MARTQQTAPRDEDLRTERKRIERRERSLDDALEGTFPASDPPAALTPHSSYK